MSNLLFLCLHVHAYNGVSAFGVHFDLSGNGSHNCEMHLPPNTARHGIIEEEMLLRNFSIWKHQKCLK